MRLSLVCAKDGGEESSVRKKRDRKSGLLPNCEMP